MNWDKVDGKHLWYLVGLITSDGCLSPDGRHLNITAKEYEFLDTVRNTLDLSNRIGVKNRGKINQAYCIQFGSVAFYNFLLSIGLMPNKSLRLGSLDVPDEYFPDFLRGQIDGDGNIRRWLHPTNGREQWVLRMYSASKSYIAWLQNEIELLLLAKGKVYIQKNSKSLLYILKYSKMAARVILSQCYYEGALGLERKMKLAQACVCSKRGWRQSKTISTC